MNAWFPLRTLSFPTRRHLLPVMTLLLLLAPPLLRAQLTPIGNQFITALVDLENKSGRFTINAGPRHGGTKFLFGTDPSLLTSNIVFRVETSAGTFWYCNTPYNFFTTRPKIGNAGTNEVPYKQYDSSYVSQDTLALQYRNMNGYDVTVRFIPEKPKTIYDDGSDLIIEFYAEVAPFAPAAKLGIFLMLDTFNGEVTTGAGGDKTSILTNRGYFPSFASSGKRFLPPFDSIPDFYHVGDFTMLRPLNVTYPIHRLTGFSQRGKPLTTPSMFAVGDWKTRMREYSWDAVSSDLVLQIQDCATAMRWENIGGGQTVRTAFGMNNREGNNMFHCRDSGLFVDIRTERVVEQKVKNGAYSPTSFDVDMWVTNQDLKNPLDVQIVMETPIMSDKGPNRLLLDPSTPASQSVTVPFAGQRRLRWRLNFNPAFADDSAEVQLSFKYTTPKKIGPPRLFRYMCSPKVLIKRFIDNPPPVDTIAPVIVRGTPGRGATAFWPFTTYDRHPGYRYDSGIDRIDIEQNDNANFQLIANPFPFVRCDTNVTLQLRAEVIDTTRPGFIRFAVVDCRGNISRDSARYLPRPDIFPPVVVRVDSLGSFGPACNTRTHEVHLVDSLNQRPDAGDNGFGSISVVGSPMNFRPPEINFDRGGVAITPFDREATFRLTVIDSLFDGSIDVRVADYAGNADTLSFAYCALPDIEHPRTVVTPGAGNSWTLEASDTLAWDRGLADVVVLANPGNNVQVTLPSITAGDPTASWSASVINDWYDASVTFEVRDRWYATTPEGHADTVTLRFFGLPDTLAPNIIYRPVPGTGGEIVDVEVNDIHYFGGTRYAYDRGLASISQIALSPNMRLVTPISFSAGDSVATFRVAVVDTLVLLSAKDSICLEAIDLAGNRSERCYYYPIRPDEHPPVLAGRVDRSAGTIVGTITDLRDYDRGLGSLFLEEGVNVDPAFTGLTLSGNPSSPFSIGIVDPESPVSGRLVLRDLISVLDDSPQTAALHSVTIPFYLPVVKLRMDLPRLVEGGAEIVGTIVALDSIPGGLVTTIDLKVDAAGMGTFSGVRDVVGALQATPIGGGPSVALRFTLQPGQALAPGERIASIVWSANGSQIIEEFQAFVDESSIVVNDGRESEIVIGPIAGDTATSRLILSVPFAKASGGDSVFVNGICERALTTLRPRSGKASGLAILNLRPQPLPLQGTSTLELDVRDVPQGGGVVELIDVTGAIVASVLLPSQGGALLTLPLKVPAEIATGLYLLRLRAGDEVDAIRVMVSQ